MFDFTASSTFELTISAGTQVHLVEEDDGSGWVKVSDGTHQGLVPATYIQMDEELKAPQTHNLARAAQSATSGKLARGLYAYDAQGDDELSVVVGQTIQLTPSGEKYADGWYEGQDSQGRTGIFPSNYVELV